MKKQIKNGISLLLCIAMIICSTLPSLANEKVETESIDSKIVEQLKEDLGEEKALEILKTSENDVDSEIIEEEPEEDLDESDENFDESEDNFIVSEDNLENLEDDLEESNAINALEVESDEFFEEESYENLEDESITNISEDEVKESSEDATIFDDENNFDILEGSDESVNNNEIVTKSIDNNSNETYEIDTMINKKLGVNLFASNDLPVLDLVTYSTLGIEKEMVTKISFQEGGTEPEGTKKTIKRYWTGAAYDDTKSIYGYIDDTEITIYTPEGEIIIQPSDFFADLSNIVRIENFEIVSTKMSQYGCRAMFQNCERLEYVNLSNFDSRECNDFNWMFNGCSSLTTLDLSNFEFTDWPNETNPKTSMTSMFEDCTNLVSIIFPENFPAKLVNTQLMFENCSSLTSLDISNFDVSYLSSCNNMFNSCSSLTSLNLGNFNTLASSYSNMFEGCSSLETLNYTVFNTTNAISMMNMFKGCASLTSLNLNSFDTTKVTYMSSMFEGCSSLESLNLNSFNTEKVTSMSSMFKGCSSLTTLDLSNFDSTNVTSMFSMFMDCSLLTSISIIDNFITTNVTNSTYMFKNCTSLVGGNGTAYDATKIDKTYARIDADGTPGYFTEGNLGTLTGISVRTAPSKIAYISGENFDPTGLVLTLSYDSGKSKSLTYNTSTSADFTFSPNLTTALTTSDTSVSINYSGFSCTQNITVKELSSINVNTAPTKLSYRVGEYFNPAGLKINLAYSDSSTDIVAYQGHESDFTFTPNTSTALTETNTSVTITYAGKTCTQTLTIVTLDTISVIISQTKTKYKVGEYYDPTGLKIRLTYTDSSTEDVVYNDTTKDNFTFTPNLTTALTMPDTSVTVGYANKTCTQNITVIELSTITVKTAPTTLKYAKGSNFNPAGLSIELLYSDNTTKETVTYLGHESDFSFSPSLTTPLNTAGNAIPITITYKGKTCTQNVQVVELSSIEVNSQPTKLIYNVGENFNPAGLKIKLNYSDSTNQIVAYSTTTASSFTFTPTTSAGLTTTNTQITIEYAGKSCTQNIAIRNLTSITIKTNPTKLSYATGQSLNPSGLVITQNYTKYQTTGNTPESIDVAYNSSTQSKFSFSPSGTSITTGVVIVTYDGKTGSNFTPTFNITVKQVATVSVASKPSKTSYYNGDTFNASGLKLRVEYTDSTNEIVTYSSNFASDYTFSPSGTLSTGMNTINVSYGGKTTTFPISVTAKPSYHGGGGGGGGGGGAISGGQGINPFTQSSGTTNTQATAKIMANNNQSTSQVTLSNDCSWNYDSVTNSWKLNTPASLNPVSNTFVVVISTDPSTGTVNNSSYYFDENGNMATGWLKDASGNTYFFEDVKNADEGKMITGWKQIAGIYYFFGADGKMLTNGMTPDGYIVNADGSWTDPNATTINKQITNTNLNTTLPTISSDNKEAKVNVESMGQQQNN